MCTKPDATHICKIVFASADTDTKKAYVNYRCILGHVFSVPWRYKYVHVIKFDHFKGYFIVCLLQSHHAYREHTLLVFHLLVKRTAVWGTLQNVLKHKRGPIYLIRNNNAYVSIKRCKTVSIDKTGDSHLNCDWLKMATAVGCRVPMFCACTCRYVTNPFAHDQVLLTNCKGINALQKVSKA